MSDKECTRVRSGDSKVLKTNDTSLVSDKECVTLSDNIETCESKNHPVRIVDRGGQVGDSAMLSSANAIAVPLTTTEGENNGLALL